MPTFTKFTELVRFDWFMKYMFRDKRNHDVIEGFLSVLLKEDITIVEILESEGNKESKDDKFNRVDVMVKTLKGEHIIIEIQNNEEFDYLQRILYGASKTIAETMKRGMAYENVKKVISVSIVYFKTGQGTDYVYHGFTVFKGLHLQDELQLTAEQKAAFKRKTPTDLMPEYYLIQALSFDDRVNDSLDEWVYLFKNSEVKDSFTAKGIDKAKEKLAVAKLPKKKRKEYERYEKSLHSDASWNEMERIKAEREAKKMKELEDKLKMATQNAKNAKNAKTTAEKEKENAKIELEKEKEDAKIALENEKENTKIAAENAKIAIAKELLKNGISVEIVALSTQLSVEVLQMLKDEIELEK